MRNNKRHLALIGNIRLCAITLHLCMCTRLDDMHTRRTLAARTVALKLGLETASKRDWATNVHRACRLRSGFARAILRLNKRQVSQLLPIRSVETTLGLTNKAVVGKLGQPFLVKLHRKETARVGIAEKVRGVKVAEEGSSHLAE